MARRIFQAALELIVKLQPRAQPALQVCRRRQRFLPSRLRHVHIFFPEPLALFFDLGVHPLNLADLARGGDEHARLGIAALAIQALFVHGVEEGEEPVKVFLRDGVVFVIVAARAAHRHAHEDIRGGFHAVNHILG